MREARIMRTVCHPSIARVDGAFIEDHDVVFVMELIKGESLRDRLERKDSMSVPTALKIAIEVCEALSCLHKTGLLHRDIRPDNILLPSGKDGADHAKVIDFGIAVMAVERADAGFKGTPTYASPEQALGLPDLDGRTDVYSLGLERNREQRFQSAEDMREALLSAIKGLDS
jgi:eukaryotic-like serine/threonine-protein kinase